mgnify:CR=1 FL=1
MMSTELEKYYNKFCEEKRLTRRHGYVEYVTSMKYIHEYLPQGKKETIKILDVGAGTGKIQSGDFKIQKEQCKSLSGKCLKSVPV